MAHAHPRRSRATTGLESFSARSCQLVKSTAVHTLKRSTTHMDTLTSINVFRQVVESGSFVGAADRLDLSTAMVSKHVMAIEKRLGVRLLNRNSHKLSLTDPGSFYLERCKAILQDLHKTELEMESLSSAPRGTLRIAFCDTCIPGLGLASVLADYRHRWPEVVVDISFLDRTVDLVEENYDLAFRLVRDESLPLG